jgi:DNA-binding transcriptional MerR regulator
VTNPVSSEVVSTGAKRREACGVVRGHFKTREVVELLDLSRRQLQYWAKTGLIEPSARTPGGHHRYSFDDLVALKATKRLIDAGVSVQKIRKSVSALQALLPQVGRPLSELVLVATGDVVLVFRDDTVFEAVSGQEWVFEVAEFEREVSAYREGGTREGGTRERGAHEPETGAGGSASAASGRAEHERDQEYGLPAKPGPRGARGAGKDWSQTG